LNVILKLAGLGRGMTIDEQMAETPVVFVGHVNGQHYQTEFSLSSWESVTLRGDIAVDSNPVGQTAELIIVASYTLLGPNMAPQWFMKGPDE